MQVELGDRIKDRISGLKGICTSITHWLNGCVRVGLQPEKADGGKIPDSVYFDQEQVEVVKKGVHKASILKPVEAPKPPVSRTGGPARESAGMRR